MFTNFKTDTWKAKRHGNFRPRVRPLDPLSKDIWPINCQYYDSATMDHVQAWDLNVSDTKYTTANETINCVMLGKGSPHEHHLVPDAAGLAKLRKMVINSEPGATIVYLTQVRRYSITGSSIELAVDKKTWQALLSTLELPPNAVELLHENNGGTWQHVSYSKDPSTNQSMARAYHVGFKSSQFELLYGRYNCQSRRSLVLIMGSEIEWEKERLISQFTTSHDICLLQILLAVLGTWLQKVEQSRWSLDLAVLKLEKDTDIGQNTRRAKALPPNQLYVLRDEIAGAQGYIRSIARHSACIGSLLEFFTQTVERLNRLGHVPTEVLREQLLDAASQYQSQQRCQATQAHDLSWRIDTQWNVLVALRSKDDSETIIRMQEDTRSDSVLMKRMAAISVVFLPATFLATFFSMMFFQVNEAEDLVMNLNVWIYFVTTTALSLSIWLYFRFGEEWKLAVARWSIRQLTSKEAIEEPMEKALV